MQMTRILFNFLAVLVKTFGLRAGKLDLVYLGGPRLSSSQWHLAYKGQGQRKRNFRICARVILSGRICPAAEKILRFAQNDKPGNVEFFALSLTPTENEHPPGSKQAMNGRERILAMIDGKPVDRLPLMPITMMFAADQIGHCYRDYAADHRVLLVEAQIVTAEKFAFDYVSCISDPAREAADCGATVQYFDDQPPAINETRALLADKSVLGQLQVPDPLGEGRMQDRVEAAALFKQRVGGEKLIEGWIEGPCAEAADLRGINALMLDFFDDPAFVRDLFEFIVEMELKFAKAQIDAGAELIGLGDAAASLVGPQIYEEFVFEYEKRIVDALHAMGAPSADAYLRQHRTNYRWDRPARLRDRGCRFHGAVGPMP